MSDSPSTFALRARWVFPVAEPPIPHGFVGVHDARIVSVGARPPEMPVVELGDVALLPGLVNAHTHLEFSDCAQPLGARGDVFADWISAVTRYRNERSAGGMDAALAAIAVGTREAIATGTTMIGEIATAGWQAPSDSRSINLVAFREVIAIAAMRFADALGTVDEHVAGSHNERWRPGVSPHAPYTVHPELFAKLIESARRHDLPVAFHLAESPDELELMRDGTGPMVEALDSRGFWIPGAIPRGTRPWHYLKKLAHARRALVVHGNYLDDREIDFLAAQRERMSVVYCPRTHDYFGHARHPLEKLLAAGARVALGTDSRASNPDLNLLAEIRFVANRFPAIAPEIVLRLGTLGGAEAIGLESKIGSIEPGKQADFAVLPLSSHQPRDPHELLFAEGAATSATMSRGAWIHGSPS